MWSNAMAGQLHGQKRGKNTNSWQGQQKARMRFKAVVVTTEAMNLLGSLFQIFWFSLACSLSSYKQQGTLLSQVRHALMPDSFFLVPCGMCAAAPEIPDCARCCL